MSSAPLPRRPTKMFNATSGCSSVDFNPPISPCSLSGADPEDVILSAFKVLDPEGTGSIKKELYVPSSSSFGSSSFILRFFPPRVSKPVVRIRLFSFRSLEELLTTQCDRFSKEEVKLTHGLLLSD